MRDRWPGASSAQRAKSEQVTQQRKLAKSYRRRPGADPKVTQLDLAQLSWLAAGLST